MRSSTFFSQPSHGPTFSKRGAPLTDLWLRIEPRAELGVSLAACIVFDHFYPNQYVVQMISRRLPFECAKS